MMALMRLLRKRRGQAMTEVVLIFPLFMFFLFAMTKVFAMLIIVQKVEIASYYAARRWQLESHRNVEYQPMDGDGGANCAGASPGGTLCNDIAYQALKYIGYGTPMAKFLDLGYSCKNNAQVGLKIERTQVWNVVTLTACTSPPATDSQAGIGWGANWMWKNGGFTFEVTKYVPNRDRPIAFVLPGLAG